MTTANVPARPPRTPAQSKVALITKRLTSGGAAESLRQVLPRGITPDAFARTAVLAIAKNHKLLNCTEESIAQSALQIAVWGLEIGRTAHIIPYGEVAQPQVDYKGMIELAMRGRSITSCRAEIIYARDEFYVERGLNEKLIHKPLWNEADRGEPVGCYAIVRFPRSNDQIFDLWSKRELEAHRDRYSKAWKRKPGERGPWEDQPLEMWRKTVVKRLLKYVPQNPLLAMVLAYDVDEAAQTDAEVMGSLSGGPTTMSYAAVRHDHTLEEPSSAGALGAGDPTAADYAEISGPPREEMDMDTKPRPQAAMPPDPYLAEGKGKRRASDAPREREPGEEDDEDLAEDSRLANEERQREQPRKR